MKEEKKNKNKNKNKNKVKEKYKKDIHRAFVLGDVIQTNYLTVIIIM